MQIYFDWFSALFFCYIPTHPWLHMILSDFFNLRKNPFLTLGGPENGPFLKWKFKTDFRPRKLKRPFLDHCGLTAYHNIFIFSLILFCFEGWNLSNLMIVVKCSLIKGALTCEKFGKSFYSVYYYWLVFGLFLKICWIFFSKFDYLFKSRPDSQSNFNFAGGQSKSRPFLSIFFDQKFRDHF